MYVSMCVCIRHHSTLYGSLKLQGVKLIALELLIPNTEPLNFFSTKLVKVDYALPKF